MVALAPEVGSGVAHPAVAMAELHWAWRAAAATAAAAAPAVPDSGGTGGPSHALVFHGTQPVKTNAPNLMAAAGGAKGAGGMLTGGTAAPEGSAGASTPEYSQP